MAKFLVFGGHGFIGSGVCERLALTAGNEVVVPTRACDVTSTDALDNLVFERFNKPATPPNQSIDGIVYSVGHCPPGGFAWAVKRPMSQIGIRDLDRDVAAYITGPINVFQTFLMLIKNGGHFVFMSSAATRLLDVGIVFRPKDLHIYAHLAAIRAQDALVEGMRMDPMVIERGIKIHKICPPAISDSPFHVCANAPKLMISVARAQVVNAIMECLTSGDHQDKVLLPASLSAKD